MHGFNVNEAMHLSSRCCDRYSAFTVQIFSGTTHTIFCEFTLTPL